jgi:hypothetical protein
MKIDEVYAAESATIRIPADFKPMVFTGVPAGAHRASLYSLKEYLNRNDVEGYKTTWFIKSKPEDPDNWLVSNVYSGDGVNILIKDLRDWLGSDFEKFVIKGVIDCEKLRGLEADVLVKHVNTGLYPEPLARAPKFTAPGGLVKRKPAPVSPEEQLYYGLNSLN